LCMSRLALRPTDTPV